MINKDWIKDLQVLVWDLDGTLSVEAEPIEAHFREKMLAELAGELGVSVKEAEKRFDEKVKKLKGSTKSLNSLGVDGFEIISKVQAQVEWENLLEKDTKLEQMFKQLDAYRHLLLTDNTKESGLNKLSLLGVDPGVFEKRFYGISLEIVKPDLDLYRKVLDYTNLPPARHLMIGDKLHKDIVPAQELDMHTCLIGKESEIPDVYLNKVYQIIDLFRED